MSTKQQTSSAYFRTVQVIYYALVAGQVIFGIVALYLNQNSKFYYDTKGVGNTILYIVALFVFGGSAVSNLVFRNMISAIKSRGTLTEKMTAYRSALIAKYSLLEGTSLFSIVAYYLTGNLLFLALSGLIIIVFLTIKPTTDRAAKELELNLNDEQAINDPNRVIAEIEIMK